MNIVHISAECYPAAKAGGLADVVGALPKYQNMLGHKASVIMPFYHNKFRSSNTFKNIFSGYARMAHATYIFNVLVPEKIELGYDLFMIDIPGLFDRENIYSYADDTERFITFQIATANWLCAWESKIDVVHCHDQHTGFIPFMLSKIWDYRKFENTPTVFTIHNGEYQGQFTFDKLHFLPPFHSFFNGLVEWRGLINPLASAIKCAWKVTTVSPGYMEEISNFMSGLEDLLKTEREKCVGILNGIDTEVWNPETDPMLDFNYGLENADEGKQAAKDKLCKQFNLDPEKPLFAFIGRLVKEKGADILPDAIYNALTKFENKLNVLILGSGEHFIEQGLLNLEGPFRGSYSSFIGYNEKLSHEIYAGADFLLMPSRVEPCGLNQLYALRYGTVPIVRRTGGLNDTVIDIGDGGFGICHVHSSTADVMQSIKRALKFYDLKQKFPKNRKLMMQIDHSWNKAASEYVELYKSMK
jgi:starch synthase